MGASGAVSFIGFLELPDMPLTDAFQKSASDAKEFLYPIRVFLCRACGLAQTQHDVHVAQYYADKHYRAPTAAELHLRSANLHRIAAYAEMSAMDTEYRARREDRWEASR